MMPNKTFIPIPLDTVFDTVRQAAESFTDPRTKSQLLAELAQNLLLTKQFDTALQTFAAIPLLQERRIALLTADFSSFPAKKIEPLVKLLQSHPQTNTTAGTIALTMLEGKNTPSVWLLINTAAKPFESEQQRYSFLEKVLPLIEKEDWQKVLHLHQTFTEGTYKDWASLTLVKHLAKQQRFDEAEILIQSLFLPLRRSWAYWEICQSLPEKNAESFFDKAIEIIESATTETDLETEKEMFAVQLRIFGKAAYKRGLQEQGEQLLEQSESVAAVLTMPMQRYRLQCFLGKVLVELHLIAAIQDYLPIEEMLTSLSSASDRSQVLVWLAEAGWQQGWEKAVAVLSVRERGMLESERAELIAKVLKRSLFHDQDLPATGDSAEDTLRLSGEEYETFYYSPFAEEDCNC